MRLSLLVCGAILSALAGGFAWFHARAPERPVYVLINETDQHDCDLGFCRILKIAEEKSGIENGLVILKSLPPSKAIEEIAADITSRMRIGARRNGRGILYVYSAQENLLKIEVSYALEGELPAPTRT